jgi:hypothetical protein
MMTTKLRKSHNVKRSVVIGQHKTSIGLEDTFFGSPLRSRSGTDRPQLAFADVPHQASARLLGARVLPLWALGFG